MWGSRSPTEASPGVRQFCTCAGVASRLGGCTRTEQRGMLAMLLPSLSCSADAGCCGCSQGARAGGGGGKAMHPQQPSSGLLGAHCGTPSPCPEGELARGARVDEILGGSGVWRRNSGARACSAHTQTGRNLFSPGPATRGTSPDARLPCPPSSSLAPQILRARADPGAALGEGVLGRTRSPRARSRSRSRSHCSQVPGSDRAGNHTGTRG